MSPKWLRRAFRKELKMSLTGDLGFVSLPEVLRLLIRSSRSGVVSVVGEEVSGRVFVADGGVALSTTWDDSEMRDRLVKAGLLDEHFLEGVESGEAALASIVEKSDGALTELLREVTVESLHRLGAAGGAFEVQEGEASPYGHPSPFELERLLEDSERRLADWAEVSESVGDLNAPMRLKGDLGDRSEISIDRNAWRVLSRIAGGSSVSAVADELGTTRFWAARVAAGLMADGLIGVQDGQDGFEPRDELEAREEAEGLIGFDEDEVEAEDEPEAPSWAPGGHEDDDEEFDYAGSWWRESTDDESTETVEEAVDAHEPAEEQPTVASGEAPADGAVEGQSPSSGREALEADEEDEDDDTDAFLAKVFSELEAP